MKVLAFDVGIKNLAFCIVEKKEDKYIIESYEKNWNIINLTEQTKLKCEYENCNNEISLCSTVNNKKLNFCSKHKLYHKIILSQNPVIFNNIDDKTKCCHSLSCKTKSKWCDLNNNKYCLKHKEINEKKLEKERSLVKYKIFVKDFTIHDLKVSLLTQLDLYKDIFLQVSVICIENQPTFKNPTMKAISDVLYTWFIIRGILEKELNKSTIDKITFFSPSNKLKINDKTEEINEEINNAPNKYKKTKELAITHCLELIKHDNNYVEHLNKFKKKDDLCDAFLHGVNYIEKNK
jgi:hypothetical protein